MRYLATEDVPLADLAEFPGNPRVGDVEAIRESVRTFGQYRSIVVRVVDGAPRVILAGNHTAKAMRLEGHVTARCDLVECDDLEAGKVNGADNRLAERGGYDDVKLADLLESFGGDYVGTGWSQVDLLALRPPDTRGDPDDIPEPPEPEDVETRPGDLWHLGDHRLICADCREPGVIADLMAGTPANLVITSPPYADRRAYDETTVFRPVPPDDYVEWFAAVAHALAGVIAGDGSFFLNIKAGVTPDGLDTELYVHDLVAAMRRRWGWHFATELCWERAGVPKAVHQRFKNQFEPVYQFTRGPWRTFPGEVSGQATAGRFGYAFEPIYQFTRRRWKMRPETVQHPSDNVPVPGGPGVGETNWSAAQGGNGPFFGADKRWGHEFPVGTLTDHQGVLGETTNEERRTHARRGGFGAKGFHVDQHQGEDAAGRAGHEADWEHRAATGQIRKRKHGRTGAMSDAQGTPAQPGTHITAGMAYPGNRLPTFAGTHTATGHTAAFPVGLPAWLIKAYSDFGDAVLDPFAGSGSTLIAAHQEGRVGYACEISPAYCDIIARRFKAFTGIDPVREAAGDRVEA